MKIKVLKSDQLDFVGCVYQLEKIDQKHWKCQNNNIIIDYGENLETLSQTNIVSANVSLTIELDCGYFCFEEIEFLPESETIL
jgi:hypothetical protein